MNWIIQMIPLVLLAFNLGYLVHINAKLFKTNDMHFQIMLHTMDAERRVYQEIESAPTLDGMCASIYEILKDNERMRIRLMKSVK